MSGDSLRDVEIRLAIARKASPFGVVRWSPNGKSIAAAGGEASGDGVVWVWKLDGQEPLLLKGHGGSIRDLGWSPDGASVASGSDDRTVRVWDAATGRARHVLEGHCDRVLSVAWSPDGARLVSGSSDKTLRVWDAATGQSRHALKGHSDWVFSVAWSPDGASIASGSSDKTVRVWDGGTGRVRYTLEGHSNRVHSVAWSPDGASLASGSHDANVRVWDAASGHARFTFEGHSDRVQSVAWSPDGASVASGSYDNTVRIWDAVTGGARHVLEGHRDWVVSVAWSRDGASLASGSYDTTTRVWDAGTGRARYTLEGHGDRVWSVAWSPDGTGLASGSSDKTVRIWDAETGRTRRTLEGHSDRVRSAAWSPDAANLASGFDDKTVQIWDAGTGRARQTLEGHRDWVRSVAWSPDGASLASGSDDKTVRVWDVGAGRARHTLEGHTNLALSVAWSPDGASVASGSYDTTVRVWDARTGRARHTLQAHSNRVNSVAWSPNGARLASGSSDKTVRVWDAASGEVRFTLEGHSNRVNCVAWSPDGASVASGSDDNTVRVWNAATGQARFAVEGHQASVILLAWSGDGRLLVSVSEDCEIRLWAAESGQLMNRRTALPFWQAPAGVVFGFGGAGWETEELTVSVWRPVISGAPVAPHVLQASAKVILAGDSNAGKTCLARRLAEDRYEVGQTTTHGMHIWTMAPEKLHPAGAAPEGQTREVFLWDLGGQDEYQLVNQLFLQDSTVALVLFDAARGAVGTESAKAWNERIETRANADIRKLLIRSKADEPGVVLQADLEDLRARLGFRKFIAVSAAREGDAGIAELREELHTAIDWGGVVVTSRPAAFQEIRDLMGAARQSGESVLYFADLERRLANRRIVLESGELNTTLEHLAREGQIVDIRLQSGDRAIVLRVDALSRYAGSLVQAARTNARGVPVLEQARVLSQDMIFPGFGHGERLDRAQEKTLLECAARLMVERGICFDHQGLLIFPTLFMEGAVREGTPPASAPVFYDFNGPIDNIYASLVARLTVSGKFGPVRLWSRYAEFGESSGGTFGLRRADETRRGRLDLYFDTATSPEMRLLFRDFVNDHLGSEGVRVLTGLGFACRECGREVSADDIRYRLRNGMDQISCQRCGTAYSLFAAAETPTVESQQALVAFKWDVEERTRAAEQKVTAAMARVRLVKKNEPLRILHLSDLHFSGQTKKDATMQPLAADLRDELGMGQIDYLVASGDFADKCNSAGFDAARSFLQELGERFGVSPLKTILVPGNHDYARGFEQFSISEWREGGKYEDGHREGGVVFTPNERYAERFNAFRRFYHSFYSTQEYPLDAARQFEVIADEETGLHFLCLNSAWRVDQFRPERAELNNDALSAALTKAGKVKLGILVWHHAAAGDRKVADTDALRRLGAAGFRVLLHGDVHKHRDDVMNYLDAGRRIHVVGGGAFAVRMEERPESTPRLYSVLEVARDLRSVRVIRRRQDTAEGPYEAFAVYPGADKHTMRGEYRIEFDVAG